MGVKGKRSVTSRVFRIGGMLIALVISLAACGLAWAHVAIRREHPPLPDPQAVEAIAAPDGPVRLSWIETASQRTPGGGQDLVHPAFVLEWADGRLLLVDTGMDADYARAFGRPMEWILGAEPVQAGRSVSDALGEARRRLAAVVFTHLHVDHTQGVGLLCRAGEPPFSVFMTAAQAERPNYTTRSGLAQVRAAPCARPVKLPDSGVAALSGFPGVGVIRVAGHTPGSQLVVAWVGSGPNRHGYVLAGDVVFEKAQIEADRPKPLAYRLLITPENDEQLGIARRWLRSLEADHGLTVVPSHDRTYLTGLALPRFDGTRPR
jgi:glyoxylase-like metal-dependent hydrolase (beta-lactamase superfamily II)